MGIRFIVVIIGISLAYTFLLFNLFQLQVSKNKQYLARAESQYLAAGFLNAKRGAIYFTDKNGETLPAVTNKEFPVAYAVPNVLEDWVETANRLAPILNISVEELSKQLSKDSDPYELLSAEITPGVEREIEELKIKGIATTLSSERYYPFGSLASQVLGFIAPTSEDDIKSGRYGVEKFYDAELSGQSGKSLLGKIILPQSGEDLILTIDPNIQIEAEKILSELVKNFNAKGGTVIVQDPETGKILAFENTPNFDPNSYGEFDLQTFINPAVQGIYEPGSVFKVITMAAGIDSKSITPETSFYDTGELRISGRTIRNWDLKSHGTVTMANVLEQSINTGAVFAEQKVGREKFRDYLEKFGFKDETGIDLPGERKGDLSRLTNNAPEVAFATAAFGQGVAVTPIEMVNAFSAIANGGTLMRPYINSDLGPKEIRTVINLESSKVIGEMLVSAVDKAVIAAVSGYYIAGKTGTAQVPDFVNGGYTENVINTYIGYGPVTNAKFVILIKLDEPEGAPLAGRTVVPAFHELAQFIVNYYNIPPDRLR